MNSLRPQFLVAILAAILAGVFISSTVVIAQGPLTPPGAPAPVMKTLDQIEPRIAINATNTPGDADSLFKITQPGSYCLTGNITGVAGKHGIEIAASGVTLDLMGFDLAGVASMGAFDGVSVTAASLTNIAVINGSVRNWGDDGVDIGTFVSLSSRVDGVRASGNVGNGISIGYGSSVTNCTAHQNGKRGILTVDACTVSHCSAYGNTGIGISTSFASTISNSVAYYNTGDGIYVNLGSSVSNCVAFHNTGGGINVNSSTVANCLVYHNTGSGISAATHSMVTTCSALQNSAHGILADLNCSITGCASTFNAFDGIRVISDCRVAENTCNRNGTAGLYSGIFANGSNNRIEGNHTNTNDAGISVAATATGNIVIRNTAAGNTTNNYGLPASGNFVGTIVTTSAAMNAAANSSFNISF